MAEDLKKLFHRQMKQIDGLHAIIVTDREGVPVVKVSDDSAPELATRPSFLSTFGIATEQASKLGLSRNKNMICFYTNYQVVHLNKLPLIVTMIATSDANTGLILSLEQELDDALQELKMAVSGS
ncbi:ragulator complex protein LAMTOR3-A-like isoform X1 [Lineus longissimus]|uniref:ragulator complex protein LAMTOR3-A-like isoform X1 n=1 Tax=Lineus longissimus TaxID=88925 RepID=UPI002B4EC0AA